MKKPNQPLPKIVCTSAFHPEVIKRLLEPKARVVIASSRTQLLREVRDADGLITLLADRVDASFLTHAPKLRALGNFAVGVNNIDLKACLARGIRVANTPGVLTRATAELTIALLFAAARRIPEGEALCRSGRWKGWAPDQLLGQDLQGRRALIVGRGRIGREVARLMRAIGLKVRFITREHSPREVLLELARAQVLSLHLPLSNATHHWLNRNRLAALPAGAIVLNTARGPIVDEKALIQALRSRHLFAAGLDVFEHEPEIPASLRKLPQVVLLPHLGSATLETRTAMAHLVTTGVLGLLGGKRVPNEVELQESW